MVRKIVSFGETVSLQAREVTGQRKGKGSTVEVWKKKRQR